MRFWVHLVVSLVALFASRVLMSPFVRVSRHTFYAATCVLAPFVGIDALSRVCVLSLRSAAAPRAPRDLRSRGRWPR